MKQKGLKSDSSNKINSALDDANIKKMNSLPFGNERRYSGVDRGKYAGSHDIVPPGCGEFDEVIDVNDLG